jgi:hypothetical protein
MIAGVGGRPFLVTHEKEKEINNVIIFFSNVQPLWRVFQNKNIPDLGRGGWGAKRASLKSILTIEVVKCNWISSSGEYR